MSCPRRECSGKARFKIGYWLSALKEDMQKLHSKLETLDSMSATICHLVSAVHLQHFIDFWKELWVQLNIIIIFSDTFENQISIDLMLSFRDSIIKTLMLKANKCELVTNTFDTTSQRME